MNARLGTQFTPEGAPWGEILEKVERKELAGTLTMTPMAADARGLLKTEKQFNIYPAIFARSDAPFTINGLDDLRGKSVAIIDPSHFSEKILEPLGSEVDIKRIPDDVKLMQMVYEGEVDAVLTVTAHNYIIAKYGFSGVRPVYTFLDQPIPSLMGVRPDWPELVSILNKGIASFSPEEINTLLVKWINAPVESSRQGIKGWDRLGIILHAKHIAHRSNLRVIQLCC